MGTAVITLPDGRRARVTFDSQEQLDEAVSELESQSTAVTVGQGMRDVPRQVGLAARYGAEGLAGLPATVANLPGTAMNGFLEMADLAANQFGREVDFRFPEQNQAVSDALTRVGLPQPQNANERVVGDMARTLSGAGGVIGAAGRYAQRAPQLATKVAERVAANAPAQAATAIGAGGAGGSVREAGGGPTEQFIASLVGGVLGGGGYMAVAPGVNRAANAAAGAVRQAVAPRDIQAAVNVELQRAGIDWKTLSADAQAKVVKDVSSAIYSGQPIDRQALARLVDYRNIGAKPLVGDITQNPRDVTYQRNLSKTQANTPPVPGAPNLPDIENQNARTVLSTLENVEKSPLDTYATGQRVQSTIGLKDAAMKSGEDALYRQARDSGGRSIPLDRQSFVDGAFANLARDNKAPFLPGEIQTILNNISKGEMSLGMHGPKVPVPFDVNTIDSLKTILATASRNTRDGNVKSAISAVRDALENAQPASTRTPTGSTVPITGAQGARLAAVDGARDSISADALGKFDAARAAARQRRTWQESAPFIEDALEGADPIKFTKKHVVGAEYENLAKLRAELKNDAESLAAVRKQLVGYILERGKADSDTVKFSSAGMKGALDQLGERKLRLFFNASEIQQIKSAINVARYSQSQPIGSAVNNSNSAAMLIGRMMSALLGAGESVPFAGPLVAQPLQRAAVSVQGMSAAKVPNALLMRTPPEPFPLNPLIALPVLPPSNQ
jgi:hypothetical protein